MKTVSALHGLDTSMDGDDVSFGFQQVWLTFGGAVRDEACFMETAWIKDQSYLAKWGVSPLLRSYALCLLMLFTGGSLS
jgi:hypothetical protein